MSALSWEQYDRLSPADQAQLTCIRLPDGSTGWVHHSGQQARVLPPEKVSDAEFSNMGMTAKWIYCRSHSAARS